MIKTLLHCHDLEVQGVVQYSNKCRVNGSISPVFAKQALEFLTVSNCHAFKSRTNVEGMVNQCRPRSGDNSYNEVCSASKEP